MQGRKLYEEIRYMRAARALAYCALCAVVQGTVVEISAEGVKNAELEEYHTVCLRHNICG